MFKTSFGAVAILFTVACTKPTTDSAVASTPLIPGTALKCDFEKADENGVVQFEMTRMSDGKIRFITKKENTVGKNDLELVRSMSEVHPNSAEYIFEMSDKSIVTLNWLPISEFNAQNKVTVSFGKNSGGKCLPEKTAVSKDVINSMLFSTKSQGLDCNFFTDGPNGELGAGSIVLSRLPDNTVEVSIDDPFGVKTVRKVKAAALNEVEKNKKQQYRIQFEKGSVVVNWEIEREIGFGAKYSIVLDGKQENHCRSTHSRINRDVLSKIVSGN